MEKIQIFTDLRKARFSKCLDAMQQDIVDYECSHSRGLNYFQCLLEGAFSKNYEKHFFRKGEELLNVVKTLYNKNIDYQFLDKNGNNILMLLGKQNKHHNIFEYFLDKINLSHTNLQNEDIFQVLCKSGNTAALKLLLNNGYPLDLSKIHFSYSIKNGEVFRIINEFNINKKSEDLLFFKNVKQHYLYQESILKSYQLSSVSFFVQDEEGNTPLHYVLQNNVHKLIPLFPIENNIWFTPNRAGETCYYLFKNFLEDNYKQYPNSIYLKDYHDLLLPLYEKNYLCNTIADKITKQQFKI